MPTQLLIFTYVAGLLGVLAALGLFFERRHRQFDPVHSRDHVFRCDKCGFVYTDDPDVDRSRCSQCGKPNDFIEF
jgi:hypothetical protein